MTEIVNRGTPNLAIKRQVRVHLSCPNCDHTLDLDGNEVDIGHTVKCDSCGKKTYYPFERPWYRRGRLIVGYIASLCVAFLLGLATNYAYDQLKAAEKTTTAK
jgi:ribosomal protein L37E